MAAAAAFSSERPSLEYLRHRGPYPVVAGTLDPIGLPGLVFAPDTGPRVPAVIVTHGYLQPVARYADTLRHLASWGMVAAAPATERGPLPSTAGLAMVVRRAADRLAEAKLNNGRVTVDAGRLAVAGHGTGAGAAVLAASCAAPAFQAVALVFATPTSPSAIELAPTLAMPSLHLIAGKEAIDRDGYGETVALAWGGPTVVRHLRGARHLDAAEGKHFTSTLLGHKASSSSLRRIRTDLTAFLLLHLGHQDQLADEFVSDTDS